MTNLTYRCEDKAEENVIASGENSKSVAEKQMVGKVYERE